MNQPKDLIPIDEKYTYSYDNGHVEILRNGEPWLDTPPGVKAWISAACQLEELRAKVADLSLETTDLAAHDRQLMVDVLNEAADDLGDTNLDTIWESVAFLRDRATMVAATHTDDGTAHVKPARRITPAAFNIAAGHLRTAWEGEQRTRTLDEHRRRALLAALASLGIEVDHA